jgi:hypothetical protein
MSWPNGKYAGAGRDWHGLSAVQLLPHRTALENVMEGPVIVKEESKAEAAFFAASRRAGSSSRAPDRKQADQTDQHERRA